MRFTIAMTSARSVATGRPHRVGDGASGRNMGPTVPTRVITGAGRRPPSAPRRAPGRHIGGVVRVSRDITAGAAGENEQRGVIVGRIPVIAQFYLAACERGGGLEFSVTVVTSE
ncbi:hypothetical protein FMUBM48_45660 [Nocardia cyriacigeorgica]|nr:hypothetical protein FMUBM48_45660 [Nocardia cyriacigeorgica]